MIDEKFVIETINKFEDGPDIQSGPIIKEKKVYSGAPGDLAPGPYRNLVESNKKKNAATAEAKKKIRSIDYINRIQHQRGEQPLNESNKMKDVATAEANKRNNVDPNRPSFSDADVIFASMSPSEALDFTGGHDQDKIQLMRRVKAQVRKQDAYDNAKKKSQEKKISPTLFQDTLPGENIKNYTYPKVATPKQVGALAERLERSFQMNGADGRYYNKKKSVPSKPSKSMAAEIVKEVSDLAQKKAVPVQLGLLKSNNYYPGAISAEDSVSNMLFEHAQTRPVDKSFTGGLHENFVNQKLAESKILREIDKELENEKS